MKIISHFKRFPILYYLTAAVALAVIFIGAFLLPMAYQDFIFAKFLPLIAASIVCFAYLSVLICDAKGRKAWKTALISAGIGIVGGALFPLLHVFLCLLCKVNVSTVMVIAEVGQMIFASALVVDLYIYTATEVFGIKKPVFRGVAVGLVAVLLIIGALPFAGPFFGSYIKKYSFTTEPSVFVGNTDYSVIFATSASGTGGVVVLKDGIETTYGEIEQGIEKFDSKVHRVDIPKTVLDNSDNYYLTSAETLDAAGHTYTMGKTITSKRYNFRPYAGDGDVSFMVVSDNQGTPGPTYRAVTKARDNYDYDFIMMLGDHAETYNYVDNDIVKSFLKVSGLASKGEKPVYFTLGNHEYRGMLAPYLWNLIPTPSGEEYYTFTVGDAFFTVLEYGVDHDDDYTAKYTGIVHHNDYRDEEYNWYKNAMSTKPYIGYRYNVVLSHIPPIYEQEGKGVPAYEAYCSECKKVHDYKWREFIAELNGNDIDCAISGHTHKKPASLTAEGCDFKQINTGSYYDNKTKYRNVIVTLKAGQITYIEYSSED